MLLGKKELKVPLIQGGMGIGISMGNLAGNVAKCGGLGVISATNIGYKSKTFWKNATQDNQTELRAQIAHAKAVADGEGLIGINVMMATTDCDLLITQAVKSGIDCIIVGAGLPVKLPEHVVGTDVAIAPVVSSAKTVHSLCRYWERKYNRCPDFVVLEGPKAGGHLGFETDDIKQELALQGLLDEVKEELKWVEEKFKRQIPVFAAGGLSNRSKIEEIIRGGADGVQVGTRFIATRECDASPAFKELYVKSSTSSLAIIESPVGMPARAIETKFTKTLETKSRIAPKACVNCLTRCDPHTTRYCISHALIEAVKGNYEEGLFFAGESLDDIKGIQTVEDLMTELMPSWRRLIRPPNNRTGELY